MKRIKVITTFIILILVIPFMSSCLNDYDDDTDYLDNPYNAALATVITPSNIAGEAKIENDNEGIAYVMNPDILTRYEVNKEGQRIFYRYVYVETPAGKENKEGPFIKITELQKILTKKIDILKEGDNDVYGNDMINYISYNLGKTHLTLQFQIYGSNTNIKHRISLVAKEGAIPDENGLLAVELRHNAEGDKQEIISAPEYVSFPLSSAPGYDKGTLKGFKMKYKSIYNGEEIVTISYNNSKAKDFSFKWEAMFNTKIK